MSQSQTEPKFILGQAAQTKKAGLLKTKTNKPTKNWRFPLYFSFQAYFLMCGLKYKHFYLDNVITRTRYKINNVKVFLLQSCRSSGLFFFITVFHGNALKSSSF